MAYLNSVRLDKLTGYDDGDGGMSGTEHRLFHQFCRRSRTKICEREWRRGIIASRPELTFLRPAVSKSSFS
jgi:hypothetical protein